MEKKKTTRGIAIDQQRQWMHSINKEEKLRLIWFQKNEPRLTATANRENARKVPAQVKEDTKQNILSTFQDYERRTTPKAEDIPPRLVDEDALHHIMRPVDKAVTDLIYASKSTKK